PVTPRTMRRPVSTVTKPPLVALAGRHCVVVDGLERLAVLRVDALEALVGDLVGGDLLEADAEELAGHRRDLRRHQRAEAVAQVVEVRVDLAGPAGRQ